MGSSIKFKEYFFKAYRFLGEHEVNTLKYLNSLENVTITISESKTYNNSFNKKNMTIKWNCNMAIITDEGIVMSAANCLNHEAEHALEYINNPELFNSNISTDDEDYHNKEDKRLIEGPEQIASQKLGETTKSQVTRKNHSGTPLITDDPTSNDDTKMKFTFEIDID